MKTTFAILISALFLLGACGSSTSNSQPDPQAKPNLAQLAGEATEVKIDFETGETFAFQDKDHLALAANMISEDDAPSFKCGYDGEVTWVKGKDELLSASFNLSEECRHLAISAPEGLVFRRLTPDGLTFLKGIGGMGANVPASLTELSWILGSWQQTEGPGVFSYENWRMVSETRFEGESFTMKGNDTVFSETLELVQEQDAIFYIPTIESNDGPVRFKLTSGGPNSAVFENPKHDFPQVISYKSTEDTILHARIAGNRMDASGKEEYGFKDFFMTRVR